jgi:hypothetical protein
MTAPETVRPPGGSDVPAGFPMKLKASEHLVNEKFRPRIASQ